MRLLLRLLFLCFVGTAAAHCDPRGEIHPRVAANKDGSFTITFRYFDLGREGRMRMMLASDGRELVPRHWLKDPGHYPDDYLRDNIPPWTPGVGPITDGDKTRFVLVGSARPFPAAPGPVIQILPFEAEDYGRPEASTVGESQIAFTAVDPVERTEDGVKFSIYCCRRHGFQHGRKVPIGVAAAIYDFPTASAPLWTGDRWWVAWVQSRGAGENVTWTTVLSSVDPESGKVEHHDLPGISDWNAHLSMAVNAAGSICLAWHSTQDGSYPGTAKIMTAFFNPQK